MFRFPLVSVGLHPELSGINDPAPHAPHNLYGWNEPTTVRAPGPGGGHGPMMTGWESGDSGKPTGPADV
jgi:hypothetical protein